MGLFSRPDAELRELLTAIQASSHIRDIQAVAAGNPPPPPRFGESLDARIDRAAALVQKLARKGKEDVACALLLELRKAPVPQAVVFRANASASFEQASEAAITALENAPPDPRQAEKDQHWRMVVEEVARRGSLDLPADA